MDLHGRNIYFMLPNPNYRSDLLTGTEYELALKKDLNLQGMLDSGSSATSPSPFSVSYGSGNMFRIGDSGVSIDVANNAPFRLNSYGQGFEINGANGTRLSSDNTKFEINGGAPIEFNTNNKVTFNGSGVDIKRGGLVVTGDLNIRTKEIRNLETGGDANLRLFSSTNQIQLNAEDPSNGGVTVNGRFIVTKVNGVEAIRNGDLILPSIVVIDDFTSTAYTATDLDSEYSTLGNFAKVRCLEITTGPIVYEKTPFGWIKYPVTTVAP